jgi:hypothetical protein
MSQDNASAPVGVGAYSASAAPSADFAQADRWPSGSAQARALMEGDAAARIAVYVRSMRNMMIFFVVITVIALIAAVVLGIVDVAAINSLRQQDQGTLPTGY